VISKDSLIFFWRLHRNARATAEKYVAARDELATVRRTLATVAAERDQAHSLLRQVHIAGIIPDTLQRRINCAVALESESDIEDARSEALAALAEDERQEPADPRH
jgi:hypothetical protein